MQRRQLIKTKDISQYREFLSVSQKTVQAEKVLDGQNETRPSLLQTAIRLKGKSVAEPKITQEPIIEDEATIVEVLRGDSKEETGAVDFNEFFGIEEKSENISSDEIKEEIKKSKAEIEAEKKAIKEKLKAERKAEKEKAKSLRVKRPIGVKMILLVAFMLSLSLGAVTAAVSYFISEDIRASSEDNNLTINARTASDVENRLDNAMQAVNMFLELEKTCESETERNSLESLFFARNKDIAALYTSKSGSVFASSAFFISHDIDIEKAKEYFEQSSFSSASDYELENASLFFSQPLLSLCYPSEEGEVCVLYSIDNLLTSFSAGSINQSFLVNSDGSLLVHSDIQSVMEGKDEKNNPIVSAMLSSTLSNAQLTYMSEENEQFIGAFRKLANGSGAVITTVKTAVVLEGVQAMTRRNIYITFAILFLSIIIIYFFAQSLSRPLKSLTRVANEINKGNFNTDLFSELNYSGKDEIAILEESTVKEREILNMVSKLTNKGVTQAVITGKIDFEPHLKDITIFFSDIRGFTAISDGFKKRFGERSAAEIISFLNDYMSRMVTCISLTGGTVDKFEGDAIMACWGVLRNDDLSWENREKTSVTRALKQAAHEQYVKEDALSAITCCIAMRYSLAKYNKDAEAFTKAHEGEPLAQYKPHIRIGAGLNSGRATVGFMGSFDKMEFTSIGDSVNFASRTEASNKPCGTDILITEDTYNLLKYDYIRCFENDFTIKPENRMNEIVVERIPVGFEVKGKGEQHFYGVVNMPRFNIEAFFKAGDPHFEVDADCEKVAGPFGPRTLKEMRLLLGIAEPDFGEVNLNEEENKIQVASK